MPYPDGRETTAERHYQKCRGPMGFHVLTGVSHASYHKVTRELARALWRAGYDVSCEVEPSPHTGWTRTSIRHLEGMVFSPFVLLSWGRSLKECPGQARVEIDVVDSFAWCDENQVRYLNEAVDLLVVPGQSSYEAYKAAGVSIPIEIVPHGVDPTVFQPWPKDEELLAKVVYPGKPRCGETLFLTGGFIQERKGMKECLEAFTLAHKEGMEASLIVLSNAGGHGDSVAKTVAEAASEAPIGFLSGGLDDWSMARLYSSVDFFVSCHKMEAFGMMPLEAMACGTPSIITKHDGPMAYTSSDSAIGTAIRVPLKIERQIAITNASVETCAMPELSVEGVAAAMRMAAHHELTESRCRKNALNWTWDAAAEKLLAAIEKHISPARQSPRMLVAGQPKPARLTEIRLSADDAEGDMGFVACEVAEGHLPCLLRQSGVRLPERGVSGGEVTVYPLDVIGGTWWEPLQSLGLRGAPFAGVDFGDDPTWFAWPGGYYPRGLGLVDLVLWAKANGVSVGEGDWSGEVKGLPPWWDGASGEAEAEERLRSHLAQLDFWWSDLLQHIRRTGWWLG